MRRVERISGREAAALVPDDGVLATAGYVGAGVPEELLFRLGERFRETGSPHGLTLIHAAGQGDWRDKGISHIARPGLLARVVAGYFATSPALCDLIAEDLVEAYTFPQGVLSLLFRNIAARKPGVFTHIGLGTFVDPRLEGGKANRVTTRDLVRVVELDGRELLFYPAFKLDVAFVRATTADEAGNLSYEREAAVLEHLAICQATRNSGGIVVAQVERVAEAGSLDPRRVKVPGNLVDYVVVAPPERHWQTYARPFEPAFVGDVRAVLEEAVPPVRLTAEKVMARRAAAEMRAGDVVNMYHGPSEALARVALEEDLYGRIHLTVASGAAGGVPARGLAYGLAYNPEAILDAPSMFDFCHGGGLDLAVLPMVQVDGSGNVNATRYGRTLKGCGSFIDVSQGARRLVFVGTHTVGARLAFEAGAVQVLREGRPRRFVDQVEQVSFSASEARRRGQQVLYVTERAVFRLTDQGLCLEEVAPGLDLERDVLAALPFRLELAEPLGEMDPALFGEGPVGLGRRFEERARTEEVGR